MEPKNEIKKENKKESSEVLQSKLYDAFVKFLKRKELVRAIIDTYFLEEHGIDYLSVRTENEYGEKEWYKVFKNFDDAKKYFYYETLQEYDEFLYAEHMELGKKIPLNDDIEIDMRFRKRKDWQSLALVEIDNKRYWVFRDEN